ncbi:MAG TPA: peptide ABC transporter substrate-binding protein [Firmicutes bacterium]|jgi:oligopeptide transport system substrate-binding protein|nr:peptide ABC transporter substrate-binding protein [Bacillota bacterium]
MRNRIFVLVLVVLFAFTVLGQAGSAAPSVTIRVAVPTDPESFDSSKRAEEVGNTIIQETQEGLVRLGPGLKIMPAGATKWEVSKDGLTWTFHLRNYTYSDGVKVKAADYVYAAQRLFDPATTADSAGIFYCIKGGEAYNSNKGTAAGVDVKALDDNTVQYHLNQPVPYFDQLANFICLLPLRKELVEKAGSTYGSDPKQMVFCGPFVVDQWIRGSKIILKKNPKFWDAKRVKIDEVIVNIVPEQATMEQLFASKQIDVIQNVRAEFAAQLKGKAKSGELGSIVAYYPRIRYIAFNNKDKTKLFTNAKVRQAFSLAIDRESFTKNILKMDVPAYGFVPYGLSNGNQLFRTSVPEPLKALKNEDPKKLLQQGLKELRMDPTQPVEVTFLQRNSSATERLYGEFYQDQWQKRLGVKVKLDVALDIPTFNQSIHKGEFQVASTGWGADYNDPMTFMELGLSGSPNNASFFSNTEYDKLVQQAMVMSDMKKRLELFKKAEKIFVVDEAAIAPLSFTIRSVYFNGKLKGLLSQAGGPIFELRDAYMATK